MLSADDALCGREPQPPAIRGSTELYAFVTFEQTRPVHARTINAIPIRDAMDRHRLGRIMETTIWTLAVVVSLAIGVSLFLWATFAPLPHCNVGDVHDPIQRGATRQ